MEYVSWGPWPLGQDNVHQPFDSVFRAREGKPARLRKALNVDMLDSGWPRSRGKILEILTGTAFNSVFPFAGYLLVQDGGTITAYDEDFNDTELVTGLTAVAGSFHSFGAQCFYTNGTDVGRIVLGDDGLEWKNWGQAVPGALTLTSPAGTSALTAGSYLVAITGVDSSGIESGASPIGTVTLTTGDIISVDATVADPNTTHINAYVSLRDKPTLYKNKTVAIANWPTTITAPSVGRIPLRTQNMRGPIAGSLIFSFLSYLLIARGNYLFRSRTNVPHLFYPRSEVFGFPGTITGGVGLTDGFYVSTTNGLYWISSLQHVPTPENWQLHLKDNTPYCKGMAKIPGSKIPALQENGMVALFGSSQEGLVAGKPGGIVEKLTDGRLALDPAASIASIVYRQTADLRQVLMLLR